MDGIVEKFISSKDGIKGTESFEVDGVKFEYSDSFINGGLNHSISDEINNGSTVEIYYKDGVILKILKQI